MALGELAPWSGSFRLKEWRKIWFCCWTPRPTSPFSPSLYCYTESLQLHSQMPWPIKLSFFLMRKLRLTEVKGHVLRGHLPWRLQEEDRGRKYQYLLSILHLIWSDSSQGRQDYFHLTDENEEAQWVCDFPRVTWPGSSIWSACFRWAIEAGRIQEPAGSFQQKKRINSVTFTVPLILWNWRLTFFSSCLLQKIFI